MRKSAKAASTSFWIRVLEEQVQREREERERAETESMGADED